MRHGIVHSTDSSKNTDLFSSTSYLTSYFLNKPSKIVNSMQNEHCFSKAFYLKYASCMQHYCQKDSCSPLSLFFICVSTTESFHDSVWIIHTPCGFSLGKTIMHFRTQKTKKHCWMKWICTYNSNLQKHPKSTLSEWGFFLWEFLTLFWHILRYWMLRWNMGSPCLVNGLWIFFYLVDREIFMQ